MNPGDNAISLIGFMGAGKSAIGRELSRRIGWPRHDTDEMIREQFGISIPDIFARHGEPAFRDAETALLKTLRRGIAGIVVTGGGIILRTENEQLLRGMGRIVWLDADEEVLWQRVSSTVPAPCSKHWIHARDLRSYCKSGYRFISRRQTIASIPPVTASRR